ncbi:UNVERIFIED_CONTAM: hypothetical protein FKN15_048401 [Acipenser sinensis]
MHYPSASSEDSASADNVSITASQNGHPRQRSRSISLKKPKKKPAPPVRNISLKKDEGVQKDLTRSERPKSLFIPRNQNIIQNSFLSGPGNINSNVHGDERGLQILITETPSIGREADTHYPNHWYLNEWKSNDPYRSLSNSSTATGRSIEDISPDKTPLSITEENDDVFVQTTTPHTTEDLFTLIHRSKRKVLGRVEPGDAFGSRQSLVSPIKSNSPATSTPEQKAASPVSSSMLRSRSRNDNFIALLQKKGSRPSPGTRVSAMELLKSTNPLARRVTEFSQAEFEPT